MNTLLLDTVRWDVVLNSSGNIALASDPYSMAQDVASACRLFIGELWYDTTQGIPYFDQILGTSPPTEFLKAQLVAAALTVPGVVEAKATIQSFENGILSGQIQFADVAGKLDTVTFSSALPSEVAPPVIVESGDRLGIDFILGHSILG